MESSVEESVRTLPKLDLHRHLDGSIRTETILDLARRQDVDLPAETVDELEDHVTVAPECRSLSEFLDCFETFYPVLQVPSALERIARELCQDLIEQNVIYAEVRFAPVLMTEGGHTQEEMVRAVLDGIRRGTTNDDLTVNLILCLYRGTDPERSLRTVRLAREYRSSGVVGIDLAGDESNHSAGEHREAFERAAGANLNVTVHAGEAGPAENVREALNLGADRIGHGVRAIEDDALVRKLENDGVPLEICLTSNLQTGAVPSLEEHPIRTLYDRGLEVTINTDDPRVSRTTITREFLEVARHFDFGFADVRGLLVNAADAAFVNETTRDALKDTIRGEKGTG